MKCDVIFTCREGLFIVDAQTSHTVNKLVTLSIRQISQRVNRDAGDTSADTPPSAGNQSQTDLDVVVDVNTVQYIPTN